jgi:3-dehydroquinate dehydratase-2
MSKVFVLNGPNLNLLGTREPEIYGKTTLADIEKMTHEAAKKHGFELEFRQSNVEGELVNWLQEAREKAAGAIINPAAYTHTSVALHDAIKAIGIPVIEVHLSNIFAREPWRHHSHITPVARGMICGFGADGYVLAIDALAAVIRSGKK